MGWHIVFLILLIVVLLVIGGSLLLQNKGDDWNSTSSGNSNLAEVNQIDVSSFTDEEASFTAEIANRIIEATG